MLSRSFPSSLPAAPTKGIPCSSSFAPGASPMNFKSQEAIEYINDNNLSLEALYEIAEIGDFLSPAHYISSSLKHFAMQDWNSLVFPVDPKSSDVQTGLLTHIVLTSELKHRRNDFMLYNGEEKLEIANDGELDEMLDHYKNVLEYSKNYPNEVPKFENARLLRNFQDLSRTSKQFLEKTCRNFDVLLKAIDYIGEANEVAVTNYNNAVDNPGLSSLKYIDTIIGNGVINNELSMHECLDFTPIDEDVMLYRSYISSIHKNTSNKLMDAAYKILRIDP